MIALVVMTDGRLDCIRQTVPSVIEKLGEEHLAHAIIHDDSGDPDYRAALQDLFPAFTVTGPVDRQGFAGAVRSARSLLTEPRYADADFVWWQEDDFVITRDIDLEAITSVLKLKPYLAQMALLRQPWNEAERAAGGVIEQYPDSYKVVGDGERHVWREHRRFFTTNPALLPRWVVDLDWPAGSESEGRFGVDLFADPTIRCAFWGDRGEWCEHIGHSRVGTGY